MPCSKDNPCTEAGFVCDEGKCVPAPGAREPEDVSCACQTPGGQNGPVGGWTLLALFALAGRRRRAKSRPRHGARAAE
jgi:MYXO-CTERM domain-containing protein